MSQMQAGSSQKVLRATDGTSHKTRADRPTMHGCGGAETGGVEDRNGGRAAGDGPFFFPFFWAGCVCGTLGGCVCDGTQVDRYPTCLDLLSVWSVWSPCTAAAAIPRRQDKRRDKTGVMERGGGVGDAEYTT